MSFAERVVGVESLLGVGFGCFAMELKEPLCDEMKIRHIAEKVDKMSALGNWGTPSQHLSIFKEVCDYLTGRGIDFDLVFEWTWCNSITFNLRCYWLILTRQRWLKTYTGCS